MISQFTINANQSDISGHWQVQKSNKSVGWIAIQRKKDGSYLLKGGEKKGIQSWQGYGFVTKNMYFGVWQYKSNKLSGIHRGRIIDPQKEIRMEINNDVLDQDFFMDWIKQK